MSSDDTRREDRNGDGPLDSAAVDRLRDRTDELELIISSLTIFALFSLPGWLFDKFADIYTHLSTSFVIAGMLAVSLLAGFSYGLAACFVVHLMARAYWVGLIGLRTAFPGGIRWDRTLIFGPIGREHFRRALPDLDQVIASTDRLASSLFAVISMLTLGALWFGTLMITTLVAAGAIGASFGRTNTALVTASLVLVVAFVGVPLLSYLLDAQLASRLPRLQRSPTFAALIGAMRRFSGLAYPRRLVLPVQLTLQSNTRPLAFFVALTLGTVVIVSLGNTRLAAWAELHPVQRIHLPGYAGGATGFSQHLLRGYAELDGPPAGVAARQQLRTGRQCRASVPCPTSPCATTWCWTRSARRRRDRMTRPAVCASSGACASGTASFQWTASSAPSARTSACAG
jgi:hypothetical protein